jgi:hypothetical protein
MFWKGRSRKMTTGLMIVMIVMRRMNEDGQGNEHEDAVMMMYVYNWFFCK